MVTHIIVGDSVVIVDYGQTQVFLREKRKDSILITEMI